MNTNTMSQMHLTAEEIDTILFLRNNAEFAKHLSQMVANSASSGQSSPIVTQNSSDSVAEAVQEHAEAADSWTTSESGIMIPASTVHAGDTTATDTTGHWYPESWDEETNDRRERDDYDEEEQLDHDSDASIAPHTSTLPCSCFWVNCHDCSTHWVPAEEADWPEQYEEETNDRRERDDVE